MKRTLAPAFALLAAITLLATSARSEDAKAGDLLRDPTFATLGKPGADWKLSVNSAAKASAERTEADGKASVVVTVPEAAAKEWHVQFQQDKVSIIKGAKYILKLTAKAEADYAANLYIQQVEKPYAMLGVSAEATIGTELKTITHEFTAKADESNTKIALALPGAGKVTITEFTLTRVAE